MPIRRVALIFDDRIRPDTAGVYVRRALAELVDVVHFPPERAESVPRTGFDLYLSVDDDTEHRLPDSLHPRAYWAIDTHLDFPARVRRSADCNLVFAAQRDGAERLRAAGIEPAAWLPLACDPAIHRKHDVPKQYDVAFVGHIFPGPRDELLQAIAQRFTGHFIGRAFFDAMARIYSASRVVFNRSLRNDVNMRVFEALACGSMLVTNDLAENGQDELFQDRVHLATYRDPGDLLGVIAYYLAHADEREAIAAAGRTEAVGRHTYRHRMERLLAEAERRLGRTVVAVASARCPSPRPSPLRGDGDDLSLPRGVAAGPGGSIVSHRAERSGEGQGTRPKGESGLTSVIVPCWNQVEFTRLCLQALFRFTRPGTWELIVVDNGSTDDTAAYLAGVQDALTVPISVITNPRNVGFPAAVNQGLQAASGAYLVLLNNDAVVTDGWLEHLVALTAARVETTNSVGGGNDERLLNAKNSNGRGEAGGDGVGVPASAGPMTKRPPEGGTPAGPPVVERRGTAFQVISEDRGQDARTTIGLVGPMSNYAAPPQLVADVPYHDLDEMHRFAHRWRDEHCGQWFTAAKLSGFCVLIKRAVYDAIGALDERFGLGFFDDDDLALRARRAGFELAVARDLFVHHFGSRTFFGNGIDAERLLEENARRFAEKWGHNAPAGRRVVLSPWIRQPEGPEEDRRFRIQDSKRRGFREEAEVSRHGAKSAMGTPSPDGPAGVGADGTDPSSLRSLAPWGLGEESSSVSTSQPGERSTTSRRTGVSLTMIVRDEEKNLAHCLKSVRGIFDEIVVVDTGSADRTMEIAREFGAKVFEFAWIDDFATARNAALEHATGDYAFWLDADDVVEPDQREKMRAILDGLRAEDDAAFVVRCSCDPGADGSGGETVVDHIRLFPLRPDVRWTYRVHEQIMPALRRAGIPVRWTDLVVRHTGYVDVTLRVRKLQRDRGILLEELKQLPDEPFILFNLGAIAIEQKDWQGALEHLGRSLAHSAPTDSITRKLFALIARAHQMRGDPAAALRVCAEGLALEPEDAELWFRKAVMHRQRGEPAEAERCWRRILNLNRPEKFASVDMGIYGHLTRRNLAALAAERGDHDEEGRLWQAVLVECPGDREAMTRLERLMTARKGTLAR